MKKLMLVVLLLLACVLFAGCSNQSIDIAKVEMPHELKETVLTETITWENVLTEEWD